MKKILCYGDSNTFGFNPQTFGRYNKENRWSGILSQILKNKFEIIEEGMNNRTGFFKNPEGLKYSGGEYLSIYLQNHRNIDIIILALGTNDAQFFYNLNENATKFGIQNLIDTIIEVNNKTKIIIIPPVKIKECVLNSNFSMMFNKDSIQNLEKVYPIFRQVAKLNDCLYFDCNDFTEPTDIDGIHYNEKSHKIIAEKLSEFILQNFESNVE